MKPYSSFRSLLSMIAIVGLGCRPASKAAPVEPASPPEPRAAPRRVAKAESEWRRLLSPEQFAVCRQKDTERAFTGKYWDNHAVGSYRCVCCGTPLFDSKAKFDSGTGWPSFWDPMSHANVRTEDDRSFLMSRTEVLCAVCDAHLGHVFDDGPDPTGKRYCINSVCLEFVPASEPTQK